MAAVPITPPGGGAVTPASHPGGSWIGSGICSGDAFTHTQTIFISYSTGKEAQLNPTWLPTAGDDLSGLLCDVYVQYTDSIDFYSTSANDGSSCSNAANAREMHVLDISAYNHGGAGFGFSGAVQTSSLGFQRRWARAVDTEEQYAGFFTKCWFPVDNGTFAAMIHNNTIASAVVRRMVEEIASGGVRYDDTAISSAPQLTPPIPKFNTNLIYI